MTNCGSESLKVTGIASSCSCLSVSPDRFSLEPGVTTTVTAIVDLTAKDQSGSAIFLLTPWVELPSGASHPPLQWILKGKSEPLITLDRRPYFGRTSVLDQPLKAIDLTVKTAIPLDLGLSAKTDCPFIVANVRQTPTNDKQYQLELRIIKPLPLGVLNCKVTLTPNDSREMKLPPYSIPVSALIVPDVECLPNTVLGGGYQVGTIFRQSLTLASLSSRPFKILSAKTVGRGLSVEQIGEELIVTQHCLIEGQQIGKVIIQIEAADGAYAIYVEVSYVGVYG